jgi:homogentisate 1,2-dioxygenase
MYHIVPRSAELKTGYAIHIYTATASMQDCCLANADGDLLLVPQMGALYGNDE